MTLHWSGGLLRYIQLLISFPDTFNSKIGAAQGRGSTYPSPEDMREAWRLVEGGAVHDTKMR